MELTTLLLLGVTAAVASVCLPWRLGIPGHNIIRVVFPMALGMALVPRRGSASLMGLSGASAAVALMLAGGGHLGPGAAASLALTGLVMDLALLGAGPGRTIHLRLAAAGVAANMVAFSIRAAAKHLTGAAMTGKPLGLWWPEAMATYAACGALAGLVAAAAWFRFAPARSRRNGGATG